MVGTAGHVDHGKTTLVRSLTGVDTDRLPEEKARQISIELGFAPLSLTDGTTLSLVDVPGHERFIRNMLAGATGVDLFLLVVDAGEGIMPQTREHLDILNLLSVRAGVVALTKMDVTDPARLAEVEDAVRRLLAGTPWPDAPTVPVSARTGQGVELLRRVLTDVAGSLTASAPAAAPVDATAGPLADAPARLCVDRGFHVPGFGLVVTGTVAAGRIRAGDRLQVYPDGPATRVRGVEAHGAPAEEVGTGQRAALNLSLTDGPEVAPGELRGRVLAAPGSLRSSRCAGLQLRLLPNAPVLEDLVRVRFHAGTAEHIGRLVLLGGGDPPSGGQPGSSRAVAFESETPLALAPGQPFVVRTFSPAATIGGGTVAVPDLLSASGIPPRGRRARAAAAQLVVRPPQAKQLTTAGTEVDAALYQRVQSEVSRRVARAHAANPHLASVPGQALRSWLEAEAPDLPVHEWLKALAQDGTLVTGSGGRVRLSSWSPQRPDSLNRAVRELEAALLGQPFSPPAVPLASGGAAGRQALEILLEEGSAVRAGTGPDRPVFHLSAVAEARRRLEGHLAANGSLTVAEFRDLLGTTRKYALPLLELFDQAKVTQRRGDLRVRHPLARPPVNEPAVAGKDRGP